jgi:Arc/MetJ family transcription regulator
MGTDVPGEGAMRTTINLDERLLSEAQRVTGMKERTALIHEGLRALIERESARRLARLGGSEPQLQSIPRRRPEHA